MRFKKIISLVLAGSLILCSSGFKDDFKKVKAVAVKSRVSVHDPSVFKDKNGTYYVFGSHIEAAKSNNLQN